MSFTWLMLCPIDPELEVDLPRLITRLQVMEFLGSSCTIRGVKEQRWLAGQRFIDFIVYENMLMREALETKQDFILNKYRAERNQCAIRVRDTGQNIQVLYSPSISDEKPACKFCGTTITLEPTGLISQWWHDGNHEAKRSFRYVCSNCGQSHKIWELDWHKIAAFFRYAIEIDDFYCCTYDVHHDLLNLLRDETKIEWYLAWGRL